MNHRGEIFRQNKPTITQQIHHINPPRVFTPLQPVPMSDDDELMTDAQMRNRASASSSTQRPAEVFTFAGGQGLNNDRTKREQPETALEPKGKVGPPKIKYTDTRPDAEKRDGNSPEDEPKTRKKGRSKKKDVPLPTLQVG